jgi:hypothetical protein
LGVKGTCTDSTGTYSNYSPTSNTVVDYYCGPTSKPLAEQTCMGTTQYGCSGNGFPYGSVDGACKKTSITGGVTSVQPHSAIDGILEWIRNLFGI